MSSPVALYSIDNPIRIASLLDSPLVLLLYEMEEVFLILHVVKFGTIYVVQSQIPLSPTTAVLDSAN